MATFNLTAGKDFFPTDQDTAGNDLIIANAGDDVVFGGPGDDQIYGGTQVNNAAGSGNDVLIGRQKNDRSNATISQESGSRIKRRQVGPHTTSSRRNHREAPRT